MAQVDDFEEGGLELESLEDPAPDTEEHMRNPFVPEAGTAAVPRGVRPLTTTGPEISVRESRASRDTMRAITDELRNIPRAPMHTQRYGDRISNAPGAFSPRTARQLDSAPEVTVRESPIGRETLVAIREELLSTFSPEITITETDAGQETLLAIEDELGTGIRSTAVSERAREAIEALSVFEMVTFVVRGNADLLASESVRRELVERRLLHRLPVADMSLVHRIDVTPWTTRGTSIVRVWCELP